MLIAFAFAWRGRPTISRHCNHDCNPSGVLCAEWDQDKEQVTYSIRTIKPLKEGDEVRRGSTLLFLPPVYTDSRCVGWLFLQVTIPYLDPILPLTDRQTSLRLRYGFKCVCGLCKYQEASSASSAAASNNKSGAVKPKPIQQPGLKDLDELFQRVVARSPGGLFQLIAGQQQQQQSPARRSSKTLLPSRIRFDAIPAHLQPCLTSDTVKELSGGFQESMHAGGEWDMAATVGAHMLAIYAVVYGWRHPLVGK